MPGKHAPGSPSSFYLSVARAVLGALAVLGAVVLLVVLVVSRGGDDGGPVATPTITRTNTPRATPTATATATSTPTATASPSPTLRPRSKVTIVVLNATGRTGLARRVADELEKGGYNVVRVGNAERAAKTTIYYKSSAKADAEALLDRYPELGRTRSATASSAKDALLTIVLGADYP